MKNIDNPTPLGKMISINRTEYTLPAGVDGYVDTDISAVIPLGSQYVVGFTFSTAVCEQGIREPGSLADPARSNDTGIYFFAGVSPNSHVELKRNALVDVHFYFQGYYK